MSAKRWAAEGDEGHTLMAKMGAWAFLRRRGTVEGVPAGEGAPGGRKGGWGLGSGGSGGDPSEGPGADSTSSSVLRGPDAI